MGSGQRRCSRGCGCLSIIVNHGWGMRCVLMGKCMGWTHIIMCHGAHVITSVQTHLICCLTCLLYVVVMHGCVMPTRCVTLAKCGTLTKCGTPTRCMMLTRLTASMPLTSTYLPTTPYSRFTYVARSACIIQGQSTDLFNIFQGINTVGVDLEPWFTLHHNLQL